MGRMLTEKPRYIDTDRLLLRHLRWLRLRCCHEIRLIVGVGSALLLERQQRHVPHPLQVRLLSLRQLLEEGGLALRQTLKRKLRSLVLDKWVWDTIPTVADELIEIDQAISTVVS